MLIRYISGTVVVVSSLLVGQVHAQPAANVLTWHNDLNRSGANNAESILTPSSVNAVSFGKVGFFSTDGVVDAEPLYVGGVKIAGATHNVVYIASEHDTVYADDAVTGTVLWQTSLLQSGETTSGSFNCSQISPEIGISSTPVIDLSQGPNGAIYVVSMSLDSSGNYHQRINALDITTGAQLFSGPTEVSASYPGTGSSSSGGQVPFVPQKYAERAGLLDWNGGIYTAWTSHCDSAPYTGWIIGYSASTLKQTTILNVTPNGSDGAIWMSGAGLAATPTKIFFLDANGTFDTTLDINGFPASQDFGNSFIELQMGANGQLQVSDYYATDTTVQQSANDVDLGSGGAMLLPNFNDNNGNSHHLAVGAGKDGNIYLVDRTNMGRYHPQGGYIYQVLSGALPRGEWGAPAFLTTGSTSQIYYGGRSDYIRAFQISNAQLQSTPASMSTNSFGYPGTTPSISSAGGKNGIVWAIGHTSPAVLYAYDAQNLATQLYNSNQSGTRDQFGSVDHFICPMIANGHVYVPTLTGVAVFSLF